MLKLEDTINKKIFVYRLEDEETDISYISAIQEVHDDYISIAIPYFKRVPMNLRAEDIVKIRLVGEGEVYILTHRFLGVRKDNIPLYILSLPEDVKRIQQRDYVRFSSVFNVDYKRRESENYLNGKTLDISGGGMKLVVGSPIELGVILDVNFSLPGEERRIQVEAKVVRSEVFEITAGRLNCVGLEFQDLAVGMQEHIISFIFTKMAEQRRMIR